MTAPYAGVSVLELGSGPTIGYAGKLFADLGADVMRVETETEHDHAEPHPLALYFNARKQRFSVDLHAARGRATLRERLAQSHVLFHAANDLRFSQWELSPEQLAREFPRLVVVSVTPYGLDNELRHAPADDLTLQALGGVSIGIGSPGRAPLKLPGNQSAFQAGLAAAIAGAGALHARTGVLIDVSAADVWASFYTGVEVALAHFGRHKKRRAGQRVSGQPYPRTIFRCKDGYFAVQCGESRHWQSFLRMIGREDLATHALFANRFKANDEHGDACDALIEPWFLDRTKDEILNKCLEHKIPGAPVYDIREVVEHPHLKERAYFVTIPTPNGAVPAPGHPFAGLGEQAHFQRNAGGRGGTFRMDSGVRQNDHELRARRRVARAELHSTTDGAHATAVDPMRPLAGLRVVDFGWVWAGAVPGHVLADMGAEVIKIESGSPLDYMRQGRPIVGTQKDPEQNPMFQNVNRGKLSLRVDLERPEARAVLKDLVAVSDVVIENFSPGVMAKFGLSYSELAAVRPDLVMCSMSAVGQQGPLSGIRTYATMIASLGGLDNMVGYPGERVLGSQSSYADPNASLHAVFGVLGALWRRAGTGEGAYLDLSQWEAAVSVMSEQVMEYAMHGRVPSTNGTVHVAKAPYGNYPTRGEDQWIAIAVQTDREWHALEGALNSPAWMSSQRFATAQDRCANRSDLDRLLALETRKHDCDALAARLLDSAVPAAPLLDAASLAAHALFQKRALFEAVEHPVLKSVPVYRLPWHVNGAAVPITRRAPLLGEHNQHTLLDVLGYSPERVSALADAGVFA
jgi:crotonobetainyl-CoA:carnitine CoA-transferase CaiB-like acyl-CoA transferase